MEFDRDQEISRARRGPALCGAIFMCNLATKKECFERNIFGLPPSQEKFVKTIKTGTVLFLFEHEERKLYGVFMADSDGAMNIAPKAFRSSGKHFPAQVRFKPLWNCYPVPEHDFRGAVSYYAKNKFGYGLSEDQVRKLLDLFSSRKKEKQPQRFKNLATSTKVMKTTGKSGLGTVRVTDKGRFVTTGRAETEYGMNNDPVPANLTRYPPSPRPNQTSILGNSEKLLVERGDPLVEGPHRSSRLLNAVEPRLSDLPCLTSQGDIQNHVIAPYSTSYLSRDSNFLYSSPSSFGVNHSTPACEHSAYSQTSSDSLFPQSGSRLIPIHLERESMIMSSKRYNNSPDVIDNLQDFIPLDPDILTPEYEYLDNKSIDSNDFEGYNNCIPFRESSLARMPVSRTEFERENICSSSFGFTSGKGPSPVAEEDYVSRRLRYWNYEPSTASIPLPSEGKSHSQLDNFPIESRRLELCERLGYDYSTDRDKDYRSRISLRSDTHKTRTSVFSRLSKVEGNVVHDKNYIGRIDMDMSVDQIIALVHQNQNRNWKGTQKFKRSVADSDDHGEFGRFQELEMSEDPNLVNKESDWKGTRKSKLSAADSDDHDDIGRFTELEMDEDTSLVNREANSEREGGGTSFVNFKRRSELQKELRGYCESLSVTSIKRRKLVRPSFDFEVLNSDEGNTCEGEEFEGNQNESSQNVGLHNEGNNDKAEEGSTPEDPKGEVFQVRGARDCLSSVKELAQDAPVSTGYHREIAEKGSVKARNEPADDSCRNESKGKTLQLFLTSNTREDFIEEEQSKELGSRNCSLNMQMLGHDAPVDAGGQKQIANEGSNKALKDLGDGSFRSEGKGNSVVCSRESNTGEDYKKEGQSQKHGPKECLINIHGASNYPVVSTGKSGSLKELAEKASSKAPQVLGDVSSKSEGARNPAVLSLELNTGEDYKEEGRSHELGSRDFWSLNDKGLSQDATVSMGCPKQRANKESTKPFRELGDGPFSSEGKGEKVELSLKLSTGDGFKEGGQSQGLGARDRSLKVQGSSQDSVVSTVGLKQIVKRGLTEALQELGDGSFISEGKGKKVKFSLESNPGECLKETGQSQGHGARQCSLHGLSQGTPVCNEAEKAKGKTAQELFNWKINTSVSKDETTAVLVDSGACTYGGKVESSLPPSQYEPQQTSVRVKKIVKRVKNQISNQSLP